MKLPNVFANKINKKLNNNEELYRSKDSSENREKDVTALKKLFDKNGYANKLEVNITTKSGSKLEKLILCKSDHFININNQKIYFKDIIDYKIK